MEKVVNFMFPYPFALRVWQVFILIQGMLIILMIVRYQPQHADYFYREVNYETFIREWIMINSVMLHALLYYLALHWFKGPLKWAFNISQSSSTRVFFLHGGLYLTLSTLLIGVSGGLMYVVGLYFDASTPVGPFITALWMQGLGLFAMTATFQDEKVSGAFLLVHVLLMWLEGPVINSLKPYVYIYDLSTLSLPSPSLRRFLIYITVSALIVLKTLHKDVT